ncbi:hypothetical protein ALC62_11876, partial [Cyphomyrmex costatus]
YPATRYETSGAVVLGASRSLIAPRVAAKRSLIKFYCAGIKLTGRLADDTVTLPVRDILFNKAGHPSDFDARLARARPLLADNLAETIPQDVPNATTSGRRPLTLRPKTHIPGSHAHTTTHDY